MNDLLLMIGGGLLGIAIGLTLVWGYFRWVAR